MRMGLFDRFRRAGGHEGEGDAGIDERLLADALRGFLATRPGTEAWIEESTGFNAPSILLVAADGESRRWSVPDVPWAGDFCRKHTIAYHRAGVEPYPQRMRDYKAREKALAKEIDGLE